VASTGIVTSQEEKKPFFATFKVEHDTGSFLALERTKETTHDPI
jgi:hypothetical protein